MAMKLNTLGLRIHEGLLSMLLAASSAVGAQAACVPKPLSREEARHLLTVIPAIDAAKRLGGRIDATDWSPGSDFRNDIYYFYMVLTNKRQVTLLDNGLIGYFAVNKRTAQVVETTSGAPVQSKALETMQTEIRSQHCISPEMVRKGRVSLWERSSGTKTDSGPRAG
jgi:hypothetical protein